MNRLKQLLQQKIERVQSAEINGNWNKKTIESETEFILLIQRLIRDFEELSIEKIDIIAQNSSIAEYLLCSAVYQMYCDIDEQIRYVNIDYQYYEKLMHQTKNRLLRHSIKLLLKSYYYQELQVASNPTELTMFQNRLQELQ